MKKLTLAILSIVLFSNQFYSQSPCIDGLVAGYPCNNVDLWAFVPLSDIGGGGLTNDIWGWVDPNSNREFALVGKNNGTSFVEITDPANPIYLGELPSHTGNTTWRDVKVFNNHAFVVSEAGGHGLQVFDLTQLLTVSSPQTFSESAHYGGFGGSHNVAINEETGFAYSVGDNTFSGGLHIVDINDPLNPVISGGFDDDGYTHDCQVVIYQGPDTNFQGKEMVFASNEDTFAIIDVDDKTDINLISSTPYAQSAYTHQCWLSPDHKYLFFGDELDEWQNLTDNTRTYVYDISNLVTPVLVTIYEGPTESIDHNLYTQGNLIFQSNYSSGLRIVDYGGIENEILIERAFFDCLPDNNNTNFDGSWSNYPYFPSGNVILTSIDEGFFIVRPQLFNLTSAVSELDCGTNSASFEVNIPTTLSSTSYSLSVSGLPGSPTISSLGINIPGTTNITIGNLTELTNGITHFQIILNADYGEYVIPASVELKNTELNIKTYLEGPYDESLLVQSNMLNTLGQIPLEEPYSILGFDHVNGGGETTTSTVLNEAGNDAIVDWIFVELRDSQSPSTVVATQSVLLQKDGDIVDASGSSNVEIKCINSNEVFVALRHRNHLGVRSLNSFSTNQLIVTDFANTSFPTLGIDKMTTIGNVNAMIAGDANNDGQINPIDKNDFWRIENGNMFDYLNSKADFNLDGFVNPVDKNDYWRVNNSLIEELE